MSLARENRRQLIAPDFLHRCQNAQLVVTHNVMPGGIALLDIIQHLLLMDVYQYPALDGFPQSRMLNFPRLEDHIAIG